ncbi:MAG: hypothetical protein SPI12_03920 [Actinomycetaceae bacterium]|nr:hypothetical protein [Actinomycetaceae bacterium]MDY6082992.1 hypothetical protein [Actinomycetaceae bacterium]
MNKKTHPGAILWSVFVIITGLFAAALYMSHPRLSDDVLYGITPHAERIRVQLANRAHRLATTAQTAGFTSLATDTRTWATILDAMGDTPAAQKTTADTRSSASPTQIKGSTTKAASTITSDLANDLVDFSNSLFQAAGSTGRDTERAEAYLTISLLSAFRAGAGTIPHSSAFASFPPLSELTSLVGTSGASQGGGNPVIGGVVGTSPAEVTGALLAPVVDIRPLAAGIQWLQTTDAQVSTLSDASTGSAQKTNTAHPNTQEDTASAPDSTAEGDRRTNRAILTELERIQEAALAAGADDNRLAYAADPGTTSSSERATGRTAATLAAVQSLLHAGAQAQNSATRQATLFTAAQLINTAQFGKALPSTLTQVY